MTPRAGVSSRLVQDRRKALDLNVSDRITITYSASPRIVEAISRHEGYLRSELLAEHLQAEPNAHGGAKLSLAGENIYVTVDRVR